VRELRLHGRHLPHDRGARHDARSGGRDGRAGRRTARGSESSGQRRHRAARGAGARRAAVRARRIRWALRGAPVVAGRRGERHPPPRRLWRRRRRRHRDLALTRAALHGAQRVRPALREFRHLRGKSDAPRRSGGAVAHAGTASEPTGQPEHGLLATRSRSPPPGRILPDVLDALAYAHRHHVVHRDIKPDNVMLSEGHALVTDFGVAKAVAESTGKQTLTSMGVALGTPLYMAPEQATADPHTDHRADIYAVGVLAYEMLCGRPPFTGVTPQAVLAAHMADAQEPVTRHRVVVPDAMYTVLLHL